MSEPKLFLSYNSVDRSWVISVQKLLQARGIATFLDRDQLVPGLPWPQALEEGLRAASAVAVFIGRDLGGWQKREMWFSLDRQVREEKQGRPFPVIPVLLPGADLNVSFLFLSTWIDLRSGLDGTVTANSLDAFEHAITAASSFEATPECALGISPYRSLEAFREDDAALFAGRANFANDLLQFTLGKDLVVVVGPSGSGKSSIVQAGLVPLLRRQLPPATIWDVVTFTPGGDPFHRIASPLISLLEPDKSIVDRLADAEKLGVNLAKGEIRLESVVEEIISVSKGTGRLLLVADQFEELFTLTPEPSRRPFVEALLRALGAGNPLTLLIILRADFYSQIIQLDRELSDRIAPAQINIGALTRDELRESITCPAKLVGLEFEPGLIDRILDDVGNEPGNLPLLEFALTELWSKRQGRMLTNAAYSELEGVSGALAQRAESEFARFTAAEQIAARRLFSRLVRVAKPEEGAEDTRRRVELYRSDAETEKVAHALARPEVRLLVMGRPDHDAANANPTVEIAHEALIRNWARLRDWLNEDREFLLWRQRTQIQVEDWKQHQRDAAYLMRGAPLAEAQRWLIGRQQDLTGDEQQFIRDAVGLCEQEQAQEDARRCAVLENARRLAEAAEEKADLQRRLKEAAEAKAKAEQERAVDQARKALRSRRQGWAINGLLALGFIGIAIFQLYQRVVSRSSGHHDRVASVAWSPDGKRLATASFDNTAKVWDAATGRELLTLRGHSDVVYSVARSPDGKRLATASKDNTAKVWDAATGHELLILRGHDTDVMSVTWSPDGTRLATGSYDHTAKVWDAATGQEVLSLPDDQIVLNVAWSPDGRRLATASADDTAKVWDAASGQELLTLRGHREYLCGVAWSPDGKRLATGSADQTAKLWDTASGERLLTLRAHGEVLSAAWSPDGKRLATGSDDHTATVWDAFTGQELLTLRGHSKEVFSVAWSPDSKRVATASDDHTARVWDAASGQELLTLRGHFGPFPLLL